MKISFNKHKPLLTKSKNTQESAFKINLAPIKQTSSNNSIKIKSKKWRSWYPKSH